MGGGGGGRGYLFKLVLGRGGGQVFWVDQIAPSKKIKTSTIWKDFCDNYRGSRKNCYGGASPIMPPPPCRKRDPPPPPPTHTEKMAWPPRTWREKTAHIKNTPIGGTPPTRWIFFIHASPIWRAFISPPCVRRS